VCVFLGGGLEFRGAMVAKAIRAYIEVILPIEL